MSASDRPWAKALPRIFDWLLDDEGDHERNLEYCCSPWLQGGCAMGTDGKMLLRYPLDEATMDIPAIASLRTYFRERDGKEQHLEWTAVGLGDPTGDAIALPKARMPRPRMCHKCHRTGLTTCYACGADGVTCPRCEGTGKLAPHYKTTQVAPDLFLADRYIAALRRERIREVSPIVAGEYAGRTVYFRRECDDLDGVVMTCRGDGARIP